MEVYINLARRKKLKNLTLLHQNYETVSTQGIERCNHNLHRVTQLTPRKDHIMNKMILFECEKQLLKQKNLSPKEYEQELKKIISRLKI